LLAKSLSAQPVASVPQVWGWTKKYNQFVERGLMLGFDFPQKLQKTTESYIKSPHDSAQTESPQRVHVGAISCATPSSALA
jgi:hypothetical protein